MNVPDYGRIIAVATAAQESSLRNIDYGDKVGPDSRGLFQQRPRWWGPVAELMVPELAAGKFYTALLKVRGWQTLPLAAAAQAVQNSADGSLYAKREPMARAVITALNTLHATRKA